MTKKQKGKPEEVVESTIEEAVVKSEKSDNKNEIFSRVFYTILFAIIGWLSLYVFALVVIIQFGFLLITGQVNTNLKGFNTAVTNFIFSPYF